jgi:hypothetical protein
LITPLRSTSPAIDAGAPCCTAGGRLDSAVSRP